MFTRLAASAALTAVLLCAGRAYADAPVLRIFLRDGTTLASYGEFAEVGGRIVFSVHLGDVRGTARLQLVSLPADAVDWVRTKSYRDAVRAAQYASTQGEGDFTLMTGEVAQVLNEMAVTTDPKRRLAIAVEARRRLLEWPARHYGYRAKDVQDIAAILDDAVGELREAAGTGGVQMNLVARVAPAEPAPLLPEPSASETIAQALSIAQISDVPAERVAMLRATSDYLDAVRDTVPEQAWRGAKEFTARRLRDELAADRDYTAFVKQITSVATVRASHADVRGLEKLIAAIPKRDAALGKRRPDQVRHLLTALQQQLDAARRLRLARDQWRVRNAAYRAYSTLVREPLAEFDAMRPGLDDIRRLAGPDAPTLHALVDRADRVRARLLAIVPPSELGSVHALLQSACQMGVNAVRLRGEAVQSGDMATAWNASAAASGALMLATRARDELARYLSPPALK